MFYVVIFYVTLTGQAQQYESRLLHYNQRQCFKTAELMMDAIKNDVAVVSATCKKRGGRRV